MICVCLDFKKFKIAHVTENQILIKMCFKVYVLLFLFYSMEVTVKMISGMIQL